MKFKFNLIIMLFLITTNSLAAITCSQPKQVCLEEKGTRILNNVPEKNGTKHYDNVSVKNDDCWKYEVKYECRETADNNCKQLRDKGCLQVGAKCRTLANGVCVVQDETYQCPAEQLGKATGISCGKDLFCVGGDCAATNSRIATENEFGVAVTKLSVLNEAAKEMREKAKGIDDIERAKQVKIFGGKAMECSRAIGNAKNCCGKKGWLLKRCTAEEKELAKAKEAGRAIEVGEYCFRKVLKKCTSTHKAYCVFDTRLARIIQNDGRKTQLRIGFGNVGKHVSPDCRGITADQLSRIDFSKIDFSEFQEEFAKHAKEKIPKKEDLEKKANSYTYEELKEKNVRGKGAMPDQKVEYRALDRISEFYERTKK